jgi:predicted RNA-binding protein associated with RNAse of E/G family
MIHTGVRKTLQAGAWKKSEHMVDYRAEWLGQTFVERASWSENAPQQFLATAAGDVPAAGPQFVWLRFWLVNDGRVVDKYFDSAGEAVGCYAPVTAAIEQNGKTLTTEMLYLGLWIETDNRITVMGESAFDQAQDGGDLTPVEVEQAELAIRELTIAAAARQFPPAFVRNFAIVMDTQP